MRMSRQPSSVHIIIDQKQPENMVYINYLGSIRTIDARCTREIESRIAIAKVALSKTNTFFCDQIGLKFQE
jgi:hypothetical protein